MQTEVYKNFVTVVDCGTISAAAKKLHIAQPALSNQVKQLEEEYGTQLLERGPRRVTLTTTGKILYENAKSIALLEEMTAQEIADYTSGTVGTLRFGSIGMQPEKQSSELLLGFHQTHPKVKFIISESSSIEILRLLKDGIIEVGILRSVLPLPDYLEPIYRARSPFYAYFSSANRELYRDRDRPLRLDELKNTPVSVAGGIHHAFVEACLARGFSPNIVAVCQSVSATRIWAHTGEVIAIASSISPEETEGIAYRRIAGEGMETTHYICVSKEHAISGVCRQFIDYCRALQLEGEEE